MTKQDDDATRRSAPSPEAAANEARTRLSLAAEAARARLGAKGAAIPPPPAPSIAQTHETPSPEPIDETTLPGVFDDAFAHVTLAGQGRSVYGSREVVHMSEAGVATLEPEMAPPVTLVHDDVRVDRPSSARHERPKRRASISPELVFGTGANAPKRHVR